MDESHIGQPQPPSLLEASFSSTQRSQTTFRRLNVAGDEPQLCIVTGHTKPPVAEAQGLCVSRGTSSCGSGSDWATAWTRAAAEMIERLCTASSRNARYIIGSREELGERALDLGKVAACSERELAHPKCVLRRASPDERIRWVEGVDLLLRRPILLPAVMVHTHVEAQPAERFWLQSTSGCAAHGSYIQAIAGAICELVERDAITMVWLQKMCLPRIEVDKVDKELAPAWDAFRRASRNVVCSFFDATRDTGIPTVYGIRRTALDMHVSTVVSCASANSTSRALEKALRDLTVSRQGFRAHAELPPSWDDFRSPHHGSSYMAQSGQQHAFDFLLQSKARVMLSALPSLEADPTQFLFTVLKSFQASGFSVYAADLTSPEADETGLCVVRVIIPELQPLSFHYRARFLAHPRLYRVPKTMGFPVYGENDLNAWPQPFY